MSLKRILIGLTGVAVAVLIVAGAGSTALAKDPFNGVDCSKAPGSAVCTGKTNSDENPLTGPNGTIRRVTGLLARIAGVAAVIVIMVGGFMYITANGESNKISEAKNVIIYAVVGLVVIVLAQYIIIFILSKV
jgi:hypothetical protein